MAGREDETQEVVADRVVERVDPRVGVDARLVLDLAREGGRLALEGGRTAVRVDGAALGGRHEPAARVRRDARHRPLLEGDDESLLGEILGEADVSGHASQAGHEPTCLDVPDRLDGPAGVLGHCGGPKSSGPMILTTSDSPSQPGQRST